MQPKWWGWKCQKKDSIVEKADLIIKKDTEHKEITREKRKPENLESTIWESFGKALEVNVEIWVNVDEQQDDKTFKVKSDIDDSDKV